ncbi:MAG: hypothetical protein HY430_02860 [Candidatus Levybacteria bacterium]|nr:hypothetical protein [Candidatus Levybacteria bacterium]
MPVNVEIKNPVVFKGGEEAYITVNKTLETGEPLVLPDHGDISRVFIPFYPTKANVVPIVIYQGTEEQIKRDLDRLHEPDCELDHVETLLIASGKPATADFACGNGEVLFWLGS